MSTGTGHAAADGCDGPVAHSFGARWNSCILDAPMAEDRLALGRW